MVCFGNLTVILAPKAALRSLRSPVLGSDRAYSFENISNGISNGLVLVACSQYNLTKQLWNE